MFKAFALVVSLVGNSVQADRRAHHWVYYHDDEVLDVITKHRKAVQSISLGCKCHASSWEQKAKANPDATWCEQLDECREFLPKLKNLGIRILMNVNLGKNSYAGKFLQDAELFSQTLKSFVAEFDIQGFSFDLESGGTDQLGENYSAFLKTVVNELGGDQEIMITGGHHTAMTHDITSLVAHADWFSMDSYSFTTQSKWQKLVSGQYEKAVSGNHGDRYIPGVSAGAGNTDTNWDAVSLEWALSALDAMGISRVGLFGAAVPALPSNRSFFWDVIESWVTGSGDSSFV